MLYNSLNSTFSCANVNFTRPFAISVLDTLFIKKDKSVSVGSQKNARRIIHPPCS